MLPEQTGTHTEIASSELPQERGQHRLVGMDQVVDVLVQIGLSVHCSTEPRHAALTGKSKKVFLRNLPPVFVGCEDEGIRTCCEQCQGSAPLWCFSQCGADSITSPGSPPRISQSPPLLQLPQLCSHAVAADIYPFLPVLILC